MRKGTENEDVGFPELILSSRLFHQVKIHTELGSTAQSLPRDRARLGPYSLILRALRLKVTGP